jgi:CheY-like chemotaxis protein
LSDVLAQTDGADGLWFLARQRSEYAEEKEKTMNMNLQPVSVLLFEPDAVQRSKLHTWLQQHDQHVRVHIHECHELPTFTAADNATVSPYEMLVFRLSSVDLTKTLEALKDEYGIPLLPVVVLVDQPGKYGEIVINNCLIEVPIFARRGQAQQREVLQTVAPLAHEYFSGIHSRLVTVEPDLVIPYALARHGEFQRMRKLLPELFLYHCGYESSKQQPIALNGNPTILWLERNNAVKMRLKSYLEQYGYRVLPVCNEEELVAWCQRIMPSLILISVDADRKTGTKEQVQRIRSLVATERVPIIVMNSVAFTETNGPDQKTGGAGYHRRPFSLQALLNKIGQYAPCKHNEQQTERATA